MNDNQITDARSHLAARLMETAGNLGRDNILAPTDIAAAFALTGVSILAVEAGPSGAAEWLRDLADAIERAEMPLQGPMQ